MTRPFATAAALVVALIAPAHAAPVYATLSGEAPLVIAHRGASGYLPEHTLAGYELAIKMGADVVEPDLQQTADGVLVAIHDATLIRTTNVADLFEPRNGGYRVADFTLAEIKTLTALPTRTASTSYPGYTPSMADPFRVPTFEEVMALVKAHNQATGDTVGIYPEAKTPNSFAMNAKILEQMQAYGFDGSVPNTFIQTFSHEGARQLAGMQDILAMDNAIAALGYVIKTGDAYGVYDATTQTVSALDDLAGFADGLGVNLGYDLDAGFIEAAHALGLAVHGWTFRPTTPEAAEAQFLPWIEAGMDGFFTDYPALAVGALDALAPSQVPLPAGLPLLAAGLGAFAVVRRRTRA
ncbi:glycerophosphodiester phosphodiesterase family protein [Rhodovulum euryhalinum]|uniref:glycerophosphodiester phosphodiesterase n=1 Tax=Rhodovulum euryhalinum TaxID=35805 RepID=A0A4R2KK27_9RHOB|nr:glycerophosphodiester phosphodiesterase family protein [Rhodovulum euryhalinum]TCO70979.1 glycerophosphoryl diester phosphodiesterase [Rhodovulum euryhalinum]